MGSEDDAPMPVTIPSSVLIATKKSPPPCQRQVTPVITTIMTFSNAFHARDTELLVQDSTATPVSLSPSPTIATESFGWSDFPSVTVVEDDRIPSGRCKKPSGRVDDILREQVSRISIEPSPILAVDSFQWGDFPILRRSSKETRITNLAKLPSNETLLTSTDTEEESLVYSTDDNDDCGQWREASLAGFKVGRQYHL